MSGQTLRSHIWLVYEVVRRVQATRRLPANVLRDDLVAAGLYGLCDCLCRHRGSYGESFERYARMRIRGAIFDELRAQDWLPRRQREASDRAVESGDGSPRTGVDLVDPSDRSGVEDALARASAENNLAELVEIRSELRALARALSQLPERERQILGMHYFEGTRFKDIGMTLGVSEPRISQLHARALNRLRQLMLPAA